MEPMISGTYPAEMINNVGDRLPRFSEEQSKMLQNSFDFIGINYYTTNYVTDAECPVKNQTCFTDSCTNLTSKLPMIKLILCFFSYSILIFLMLFPTFSHLNVASGERNGIPIGPKVNNFKLLYCTHEN